MAGTLMSGQSTATSVVMAVSWRELFSSDRWLRRFVVLVVVDLLALGGGFALDADFGTAPTFLPFAVLEIAGIFLALWLALAPSAYMNRRSIAALSEGTPASVWKLWGYGPNIRTLSSIDTSNSSQGKLTRSASLFLVVDIDRLSFWQRDGLHLRFAGQVFRNEITSFRTLNDRPRRALLGVERNDRPKEQLLLSANLARTWPSATDIDKGLAALQTWYD
jgi:hypothetical protein